MTRTKQTAWKSHDEKAPWKQLSLLASCGEKSDEKNDEKSDEKNEKKVLKKIVKQQFKFESTCRL